MIEKPMDVLTQYPIRKSKLQKAVFRDDVMQYIRSLGYSPKAENGSFGARNVVFGNQEGAKYLVTAHYDTCARLPFPNFLPPCNFWAYLFYQLAICLAAFVIAFIMGLAVNILTDEGSLGSLLSAAACWLLLLMMFCGPANIHNANDNTSGIVTVLEIAAKLPAEARQDVCFVLFDLEEAGLFGSAGYRSKHKKATNSQLVLNLDCVGDGNEIMLFPCKRLRKNKKAMAFLTRSETDAGEKSLRVHKRGYAFYPSDQANFPYGVGIAAFRRNKYIGLYCSRIHTSKDTILEEANVQLLSRQLTALITNNLTLEEIQ